MYPARAVPPSHQIRISPEKSEFDAKGVVVWWLVDGESLRGDDAGLRRREGGCSGGKVFFGGACLLRAATAIGMNARLHFKSLNT